MINVYTEEEAKEKVCPQAIHIDYLERCGGDKEWPCLMDDLSDFVRKEGMVDPTDV